MTPRKRKRLIGVGLVLTGVAVAAVFVLQAYESNMTFFFSPEQVAAGEVQPGQAIRLGGLVVNDSFERAPGSMEARFLVTDNTGSQVTVSYTGVLPDLFKEGQGVVAEGEVNAQGVFIANEVLAKHDENYMSPQVAKMLEEQGHNAAVEARDAATAAQPQPATTLVRD